MRKPATSASTRRRVRLPLPAVRVAIWQAACELITAGESREISAVLAGRFNTGERIIDAVLVAEGMRHERTAAALKTCILGALELARDAGAAIDTELSDVA
jgi:hypothetical protein